MLKFTLLDLRRAQRTERSREPERETVRVLFLVLGWSLLVLTLVLWTVSR